MFANPFVSLAFVICGLVWLAQVPGRRMLRAVALVALFPAWVTIAYLAPLFTLMGMAINPTISFLIWGAIFSLAPLTLLIIALNRQAQRTHEECSPAEQTPVEPNENAPEHSARP